MPSPSLPLRFPRALRSSRALAFLAVPLVLVASPARADECATNADCGFGFACETVVTSSGTGTGGIGGASGSAGTTGSGALPQGGTGTAGFAGTGTSGSGGTGAPRPMPVCGNLYCETPGESPETCPDDCVFTTVCTTAVCTNDAQCASGYVCPPPGTVGTGGGPSAYCGDLLCSGTEDAAACPVDCDPNYRRCTLGDSGCASNSDCSPGYVCVFTGGSGGTGGASGIAGAFPTGGVSGGFAEGGAPAEAPWDPAAPQGGSAFTGGSGGFAGGTAGTGTGGFGIGGSAGVGVGGTGTGGGAGTGVGGAGAPGFGMCIPGTGGTYGGTGGDSYGGTSGTAGTSQGGSGALGGGTGGNGGTNRDEDGDDEKRIITDRGCTIASSGSGPSFAALVVAAAALVRFGRRRARR